MYYLGIDPGKINIGIVLCKGVNNNLEVLTAIRSVYKNDKYFIKTLSNFLEQNNVDYKELKIVIERQPRSPAITGNMRFIQGYMLALGSTVIMKMPITHGKSIQTYKERKQYSVDICKERIKCDYVISSVIDKALEDDIRKHDIADGFNLVYDEWYRDFKHVIN